MVPCSLNSAFTDPPAGAVGSASTRSPRSRLWIAPRRFCRCARDPRAADHDYIRHGTNSLFAALEVATGKITADACYPHHTHVDSSPRHLHRRHRPADRDPQLHRQIQPTRQAVHLDHDRPRVVFVLAAAGSVRPTKLTAAATISG